MTRSVENNEVEDPNTDSEDEILPVRDNRKYEYMKFLLTNARSLSPKIISLQTAFEEHELDFALITESWLRDGQLLDRDVIDLEHGSNLRIIYKNRPTRGANARRVGGGVSIVYNKASCNFRERRVAGNKFEMVVASGKINKSNKMVFVYCVYIQPRMLAAELGKLKEVLADDVTKIKTKHPDPVIYIGGDMNKRDLLDAVDCFRDMERKNFDATRGEACLDVLYSNASVYKSKVWPPLETPDGTRSDHDCVIFTVREEQAKDYKWVKRNYRKYTDKACRQYGEEIRRINWESELRSEMTPDEMVDKFEKITKSMTDRLFPLRTIRCRSNELPWVTERIRKLSKLKRRVYKRQGKSDFWKRLDAEMEALTTAGKAGFVDRVSEDGPNSRKYFQAIKALSTKAKPKEWSVMDLFPGLPVPEVGSEITGFFSEISNQFEPLEESRTPPATRPELAYNEVALLLAKAKKPQSQVDGDVPPKVMKLYHGNFVEPVRTIFNAIIRTSSWPTKWKEESTVVIPKTTNPTSLSECRNISCTSFLSKVLESQLLIDLRREIPPDNTQFGGNKGCSVDHLLTELLEGVLSSVDKGNPAVLLGIDYEKAFNRLDHKECLKQLRLLGASEASLGLVRSFLTGRIMKARIGEFLSGGVKLCGGSPQGSILGCYLYCTATQQVNSSLARRELGPNREPARPEQVHNSPDQDVQGDVGFNLLADDLWPMNLTSSSEESEGPPALEPGENINEGDLAAFLLELFKYIDDTTSLECIGKESTIKHFTTRTTEEFVPAPVTEQFLLNLIEKTEEIGMRVNCKKTQLLCVSPENGCESFSVVQAGQEQIESVKCMKLLGFMIGNRPGVTDHFEYIRAKFRARFWSLIHLRRAGIVGLQLFKLYVCFVRPVLESNSVIYHPMLTRYQSQQIEGMQKRVIRLCFGCEVSSGVIRDQFNIETLEKRRENAARRFVEKTMKNPRFAGRWFRRREEVQTELRRRKPFVENRANTNKYKNSPLVYFQRVANTLVC